MRKLLATDGSPHSEAAVDEIAHWHYLTDGEVRVISVVDPPNFPTTYPLGGVDMEFSDQMEKHAREATEKAAAKLRAADESRKLNVTTKVLSGSPKGVILEEAEAFSAGLIVVGSHGHGALERFLLGSVSQAVALHAKCSVEIVRRPEVKRDVRRVLLAIDGSGHSEAAVDEIAHRYYPADSEVRVISIVEPLMPLSARSLADSAGYHGELEKIERERASSAIEKAAARLRESLDGCSMKITTQVLSGSPKRVILEEAEASGADLIVVGSHGHGMLESFLLGSVSQAVALHARCSVEIVRSPKSGAK